MKQGYMVALLVIVLLPFSVSEGQLKVVQVNAPKVNCVFDTSCTIVVSDTTAPIPIAISGTNFLQSRTFTGKPGAPANGLFGYDYRINLTKAVSTSTTSACVQSLTIGFGPVVKILDYDNDGSPDDVYVVTTGGLGSVGLASAVQDAQGNITFTFNPAVCAGTSTSGGQTTFFFGLTSTQPPQPVTATVTEVGGAAHPIAARAPQPAPPCSMPPYSPGYWNDGGTVQWNNNCYNYGNNKRTDTFAQPGLAAGAEYSMPITCTGILNAATADGLVPLPASGTCPGGKDKIAFVVAPCVAPGCAAPYFSGNDFHWYRLGTDGMWTHKPGGGQATNLDESGHTISNPETANRCGPYLCYSQFCGYFCSCSDAQQGQGHENIK
jgi:hypothetical protein